jgi:hypothetical protein
LLHPFAVLHHGIDALEQGNLLQHVAFYGDDAGIFAFGHRAVILCRRASLRSMDVPLSVCAGC